MYLAQVRAENFRIFGSAPQRRGADDESLRIDFGPGINVLVGENDSGKTAIVDAIRLCLLTTAADFYRISKDDFHAGGNGRADTFSITCAFRGLTAQEQGTFLELVTTEERGETALYVTLKAQLMDPLRPSRMSVTTRTGPDGKGPALDGAARELLKATYLNPSATPRPSCDPVADHGCRTSSPAFPPSPSRPKTTSTRTTTPRRRWWASSTHQRRPHFRRSAPRG